MANNIRKIEYQYKGATKKFNLIECENQITTICEVRDDWSIDVVSEGMEYEELISNFPPDANSRRVGMKFCMLDMIRAIIWESYRDEGTVLEPGNVRHFWYTHIKYLVEDILRMGESASVKQAINKAWENLIVSGLVTYEDMNITSAKENVRESFIRDSPFMNLIVAAEKENLFEDFKWIAELFNCTVVTAGGQPSRAVSRNQARQLIEEMKANGTDLNQTIYFCTISDLDPAGYYIQEAFKNQLQKAMEYYGGTGNVKIERLFVTKEQVAPELLKFKAMKCEDEGAVSERAKKAEDTKWEYFCKVTDGGLYKVGADGKEYRAKMELDAFPTSLIEKSILEALLKIIHETSDESLVMIPEIMRIFSKVRKEVIEEIFNHHKEDWLRPIIDEFLSKTKETEQQFKTKTHIERIKERNRFRNETQEIRDKYKAEREESNDTAQSEEDDQQKIIDAYKEKEGYDVRLSEIEDEIAALKAERDGINNDVNDHCSEQFKEIGAAWDRHNKRIVDINKGEEEELTPFKETHEGVMAEIQKRGEYRQSKLDEYRRWKEADFNPVEQALHKNTEEALDIKEMDFRYRALEKDNRTKPHIAKLLLHPETLLEDETSAWDQEYPVFTEKDLLIKASAAKSKNVEPHRRGFTPDFLGEMNVILHEVGDDVEVEYPEAPELEDITEELQKLVKEVEEDIEEGKHHEDDEDEDEENSDDEDNKNIGE